MGQLEEILERLQALPAKDQEELQATAAKFVRANNLVWVPNPGPQTDAYLSKADILLYGGEAGGGKTDLLLGLAFCAQQRSLLMRREYTDLGALTERAIKVNGSKDGFNGSAPPKLATKDGRRLNFGAAKNIGDEEAWQGQAHDFLGIDEAAHWAESQIRFLLTWNRSTIIGQRCRVVLATNPPVSSIGLWLIDFFAAWLDPKHPRPAAPGELRWYVTDEYGKDMEVEGPGYLLVGGKRVRPLSRTFIPASVDDNPFLAGTDYKARLDSLPEPYRSAFRDGNFMLGLQDDLKQVIPTDWVRQAQKRWTPRPPPGIPMCAIGVDVARGGQDDTILAPRHDAWFAPVVRVPGAKTPLGSDVAGLVVANRRDSACVVIDMGGGYGGAPYEHLRNQGFDDEILRAYNGANTTTLRTRDGKLGFTNVRSASIWRFRELLDPDQPGGSPCALPDDPRMVADLTAPRFEITPRGIKVESKEDVCDRLKRSTDAGDGVVMSWTAGPKMATHGPQWLAGGAGGEGIPVGRRHVPKVVMGHQAQRRG